MSNGILESAHGTFPAAEPLYLMLTLHPVSYIVMVLSSTGVSFGQKV